MKILRIDSSDTVYSSEDRFERNCIDKFFKGYGDDFRLYTGVKLKEDKSGTTLEPYQFKDKGQVNETVRGLLAVLEPLYQKYKTHQPGKRK